MNESVQGLELQKAFGPRCRSNEKGRYHGQILSLLQWAPSAFLCLVNSLFWRSTIHGRARVIAMSTSPFLELSALESSLGSGCPLRVALKANFLILQISLSGFS